MFRQIFYEQFADIRREEWPRALLLSGFFFLIIATYWILKPLKRGAMIGYFDRYPITFAEMNFSGAEAEQFGKVLNLVLVYLVVVLFTYLARRVPRHYLVLCFAALFAGIFGFFANVIHEPTAALVMAFYVFGDMFNTAMVALFWAFTDDVVEADEAQRTYGLIGLGGVVGGLIGATIVQQGVEHIGRSTLLVGCIFPMVLVTGIAFAVHRITVRERHEAEDRTAARPSRRAIALEGAQLVFSSRYLLAIAGMIAAYELVSNIVDFQVAAMVEREIINPLNRDEFFAVIGQVVGVVAILVQLFFTSYVMKRYGVGIALFFLPAAIALSSGGFLLFPSLFFAASMSVSDNAFNYSINQSAKEALYVPTSSDVTYKAKAFIDMFVQRCAKVVAVVINLVFVSQFAFGLRLLSVVTLVCVAVWLVLVRYAGRVFHRRAPGRAPERA